MLRSIHTQIKALVVFLFFLFLSVNGVAAEDSFSDKANKGTVGIVSGSYGQLGLRLASEMATVLNEGDQLRIVPIVGRGEISNIADMLYLRGVDGAIVPLDVLDYADRENLFPGLKRRINLVCRLHILDVYVVARRGVRTLSELKGSSINVVSKQHGAFVTARNIFGAKGIDYTPVFHDQRKALQMISEGKIAATVVVSGRPNLLLQEVTDADNLAIIPIPFSTDLPRYYYPVKMKPDDYPDLLPLGEELQSVATTAALVVFNFNSNPSRRAKVSRFTDAFLTKFPELQSKPRHPRWRDVSLASSVEGWTRYPPAEAWLKLNNTGPVRLSAGKSKSLKALFQEFLDSEVRVGRAEELQRLSKAQLFKRFVAWRKARTVKAAGQAPVTNAARSLRQLFDRFIGMEAARVGKEKFRKLTKDQLFKRFLRWRKRGEQ